jgi:hypothetical protein
MITAQKDVSIMDDQSKQKLIKNCFCERTPIISLLMERAEQIKFTSLFEKELNKLLSREMFTV